MRLEHISVNAANALLLFQFHKGAIRTIASEEGYLALTLFQFHKGAIRTAIGK